MYGEMIFPHSGSSRMTDLTPTFLPDLLKNAAAKYPARTVIDFLDTKISYAELWQQAQRVAAGLQQAGLKKGERVGLMLPNCPAYLQSYFGVLLAGGTVVNINPLYAPHELKHIIEDSDPRFVITLDLAALFDKLVPYKNRCTLIAASMVKQLPLVKGLAFRVVKANELAKLPDGILRFENLLDDQNPLAPVTVDLMRDVAVLQYTGGTTGTSKAAMLSHANLSINAKQSRGWFARAVDGEETALAVIPFFHAFALTTLVNLSVLMGTTIIALPRFDLKQLLKTIHHKKPTIFPAVPTIYNAINSAPDLDKYDIRSLKFCVAGGAPLPLEVKQTFENKTGCILVEGYGLSETSPVVTANPQVGENRSGSIGKALEGTVIEIVSLEDRETIVPDGDKGELCVRGPQVMLGYWNKPLETADIMKGGRLHTGDVAIKDAQGYVYIVDRIKDMILCGGYNVYPRNIEEAVYQHKSVEEVVCAGVPDSYRGETVKIWVKLKPGYYLTADDLKNFLKNYLSPIEMPKYIEFRNDPLPKTLIGKLSRKALLEQETIKRS